MSSSVYRPFMITSSHIRCQSINVLGIRSLDAAITQERKSVLISVGDIIIFDSGVFDGLQEMNGLFAIGQQWQQQGA